MNGVVLIVGCFWLDVPVFEPPDNSSRCQTFQHPSFSHRRAQAMRLWCFWSTYKLHRRYICGNEHIHVPRAYSGFKIHGEKRRVELGNHASRTWSWTWSLGKVDNSSCFADNIAVEGFWNYCSRLYMSLLLGFPKEETTKDWIS